MKSYYCDILHDNTSRVWSARCSTPVIAMNKFHERAQKVEGTERDAYNITGLWCYGIEYDLPNTRNPDLLIPAVTTKLVTPEFDGMPQPGEGGWRCEQT